jgi:ATP-dependent Clp protease ATP-binding subunit ClpC
MYDRYTHPAKLAVYFAHSAALLEGAGQINSEHLLLGLIIHTDSRASTLFHLQEHFTDQTSRLKEIHSLRPRKTEIPLTNESKRILAYAAVEAARLRDYWIDTEHLLLGTLREQSCEAAQKLNKIGLQIKSARKEVKRQKHSRPQYGPVPWLWRIRSGPSKILSILLYG